MTRQLATPIFRERLPNARQGEVRPERTSVHLETKTLACTLYVMVQQFESRIGPHTDPYDAGPAKVRERPDATDGHEQTAVLARGASHRGLNVLQPLRRRVAEELEREMEARFVDPRELWSALTQCGGRRGHLAPDFWREVNRQKETHRSRSTGR